MIATANNTDLLKTQIQEVFEKQKEFATELKTIPIYERTKKLKKILNYILKNREEIQKSLYQDFKKNPIETEITETFGTVAEIRHIIKNLEQWLTPKKVDTPLPLVGSQSKIMLEPKGVTLIISPWNYPFSLAVAPLVCAIAAGNTVILKPSELSANTSSLLSKMIKELFDEKEVTVFEGDASVATELLKYPFDHIFFTGSTHIGKKVMEAASKNLSSITLELGGKSPVFIEESADIEDTAEKIVWGKFINTGQTCIAPDYIMVPQHKKALLVSAMKRNIEKFYNADGKGIQHCEYFGRIINDRHFNRLTGLIEDAINKGANIAFGGKTSASDRYIEPALLVDVEKNMKVMQEEIFGPVLPIIGYEELDNAIRFVTSMEKPLALYVFSQNKSKTNYIIQKTSAGTTCINECVIQFSNTNLPFGGVNHSGIGKSHGYYGVLAFSNERSILEQRTGLTTVKALYPPYNELVKSMIDAMIKWL
jgi:aldehyde dehydrogenase (NAD+)